MPELVVRREAEGVVYLTLNRPRRLNALSSDLVLNLGQELSSIPVDTTAVVLKGSGSSFSAGHDLRDAAEHSKHERTDDELRNSVERMQDITRRLRNCPAPVIGAIHGYAVGAGCEIALSCDLVVAARDAQFGFPETGVSLIVTNGVTALLARSVGSVIAKELILLGEFITAERAAQLGLVNRVVDTEVDLDGAVADIVQRLRTRGPEAVRQSKRLIDDGLAADIEVILSRESEASVIAERSANGVEGVVAFAEGRTPSYGLTLR